MAQKTTKFKAQKQVVGHHKHVASHNLAMFSMRAFNAEVDLPIVYHPDYNIRMMGLELSHRFDTKRYEKIADYLSRLFHDTPFSRPIPSDDDEGPHDHEKRLRYLAPNRPISTGELQIHHTADYVNEIHEEKSLISRITETWFLYLIPQCFIESNLLIPIRYQVAGTVFASYLALQHGWAINLGGGFHTAFADLGENFCIFNDVLVAMKLIWRKHPFQKFMIIDLDAHQGTGIARDLLDLSPKQRAKVFMVDIFNSTIQTPDLKADKGCHIRVDLARFTGDGVYMKRLNESLELAFARFKPTLIFYIAGQDVLKDDQMGLMNISDDCFRRRDELVFRYATERNKCPIVMLLGGGFMNRGIRLQASSIRSLFARGLIWGGHKSGSRTLTRPRPFQTPTTSAKTVNAAEKSASRKVIVDSVKPEVDAESQSISTSSGARKTQVIRLARQPRQEKVTKVEKTTTRTSSPKSAKLKAAAVEKTVTRTSSPKSARPEATIAEKTVIKTSGSKSAKLNATTTKIEKSINATKSPADNPDEGQPARKFLTFKSSASQSPADLNYQREKPKSQIQQQQQPKPRTPKQQQDDKKENG